MKKIGLALAGGGARGAYQIGAWKALIELGIVDKISAYSGASVGSLNAVLFAMGDYESARDTWLKLDKDSLFNMEKQIYKRIFKEKLNFLNRGIYSTKRLEKLLDNTIDYDKITDKEVYIATTYLGGEKSSFFDLIRTNYKHYFKSDKQIKYQLLSELSKEDIRRTMLASCAIPVAFQPVLIGNQTYYDGGLLDNTPYQPLIEAGCDLIIVIDLFKISFTRKKEVKGIRLVTVHPKKSLRGVLDFNNKHIHRRFQLGYEDTIEKLSKHIDLFDL
ncbi:MAG: patatin-like phospholipase family protein [Candidatus Izimaplasma sp.]|nr:patatin-like phospholipase family protein [Candidatus Izimaplasma bacterium]